MCCFMKKLAHNLFFFALIFTLFLSNSVYSQDVEGYKNPAFFKITDEVVNPDLKPFTATINGIGNNLIGKDGGFEPVVYRNRYLANKNSKDIIYANPQQLSHFNSLKEGALDNADVYVYRIENEQFQLVRQDKIRKDGFHVSGWQLIESERSLVAPQSLQYWFKWAPYNRSDVKYYFTVSAVDSNGNESGPAVPVAVIKPPNIKKARKQKTGKQKTDKQEVKNELVKFKKKSIWPDSTPPDTPENLKVAVTEDSSLLLTWDASKAGDVRGYRVYQSEYPPEAHKGYYVELEGEAVTKQQHIHDGDMIIVSKKFYKGSRKKYLSNRLWGAKSRLLFNNDLVKFFSDENPNADWKLVKHTKNTPVEDPGETFLRISLKQKQKVSLGMYNHSGIGQQWYSVLEEKPYKIEVWLRSSHGGKVSFRIPGFYAKNIRQDQPFKFVPGKE